MSHETNHVVQIAQVRLETLIDDNLRVMKMLKSHPNISVKSVEYQKLKIETQLHIKKRDADAARQCMDRLKAHATEMLGEMMDDTECGRFIHWGIDRATYINDSRIRKDEDVLKVANSMKNYVENTELLMSILL